MFLITKCRNGFLLLPSSGVTASANMTDAFYLADVPEQIREAFKAEEEARKLRAVGPELVSISKSLDDLPVLNEQLG